LDLSISISHTRKQLYLFGIQNQASDGFVVASHAFFSKLIPAALALLETIFDSDTNAFGNVPLTPQLHEEPNGHHTANMEPMMETVLYILASLGKLPHSTKNESHEEELVSTRLESNHPYEVFYHSKRVMSCMQTTELFKKQKRSASRTKPRSIFQSGSSGSQSISTKDVKPFSQKID